MLNMLNWQSLEQRRNQAKSIMFDKIINNMVFVNFHQYLQPSITIIRGHHLKFIQLQARVDVFLIFAINYTLVELSTSQCRIITYH